MNGAEPVRLLYIDDDDGFARLTMRSLGAQGFEVVHAANGDLGLAALATGRFDAIALDHVMPLKSGPETLADIIARPDHPPVIYVTAADEGRIAVDALKAGASDYVLKDLGESFFELLGETIRQAIASQQARRERAAAQAEVAAARDRAEALLREVNHRVANSLALVSSFAHLQAGAMPEGAGRDAVMDLKRRVIAVGQVHRRLYTSQDVRSVDLADYLERLVEDLRASMADEHNVHDVQLSAEPIQVPTDKAIALGVMVSELVTNACKYAYRGGAAGPVAVKLARAGEADGRQQVQLDVSDSGVGMAGGPPKGSGLGTRILSAMAKTLRAEVVYPPVSQGTCVQVRFAA